MSDMVAYLTLDDAAYQRGLRRAEAAAGGYGAKIGEVFVKQQKKSFDQLLGGNWGKAAIGAATVGFGIVAKAQSDFAEKNQWAAESTKVLRKELNKLWDDIGARASLVALEAGNLLQSLDLDLYGSSKFSWTDAFNPMLPLKIGMRKENEETEKYLADMKAMEKALTQVRTGEALREQQELRYLEQVAPYKAARLKEEIQLRERLAEIGKLQAEGKISSQTADAAKARERAIFEENRLQVDPEWWKAQVEPMEERRKAAAEKKEKAKEAAEEKRALEVKRREENRISLRDIGLQERRDAIEIARMTKQEKRAAWLQHELDVNERLQQIQDQVLTVEQRREAIQSARLASAAKLVAELRQMGESKLLPGQSIGSGLFSRGIGDQVYARNTQAADPQLKIAMDLLKAQVQATERLGTISDTTRQIVSAVRGGVKARYGP